MSASSSGYGTVVETTLKQVLGNSAYDDMLIIEEYEKERERSFESKLNGHYTDGTYSDHTMDLLERGTLRKRKQKKQRLKKQKRSRNNERKHQGSNERRAQRQARTMRRRLVNKHDQNTEQFHLLAEKHKKNNTTAAKYNARAKSLSSFSTVRKKRHGIFTRLQSFIDKDSGLDRNLFVVTPNQHDRSQMKSQRRVNQIIGNTRSCRVARARGTKGDDDEIVQSEVALRGRKVELSPHTYYNGDKNRTTVGTTLFNKTKRTACENTQSSGNNRILTMPASLEEKATKLTTVPLAKSLSVTDVISKLISMYSPLVLTKDESQLFIDFCGHQVEVATLKNQEDTVLLLEDYHAHLDPDKHAVEQVYSNQNNNNGFPSQSPPRTSRSSLLSKPLQSNTFAPPPLGDIANQARFVKQSQNACIAQMNALIKSNGYESLFHWKIEDRNIGLEHALANSVSLERLFIKVVPRLASKYLSTHCFVIEPSFSLGQSPSSVETSCLTLSESFLRNGLGKGYHGTTSGRCNDPQREALLTYPSVLVVSTLRSSKTISLALYRDVHAGHIPLLFSSTTLQTKQWVYYAVFAITLSLGTVFYAVIALAYGTLGAFAVAIACPSLLFLSLVTITGLTIRDYWKLEALQ
eukprot:g4072.t1